MRYKIYTLPFCPYQGHQGANTFKTTHNSIPHPPRYLPAFQEGSAMETYQESLFKRNLVKDFWAASWGRGLFGRISYPASCYYYSLSSLLQAVVIIFF